MERNKLLTIALAVSNIFRVLIIVFITLFTFGIIHYQFNPDLYSKVELSGYNFRTAANLSTSFYTSAFEFTSAIGTKPASRGPIYVQDASNLSLIIFYLQHVIILAIWVLMLQQIARLIQSVKVLQTFRQNNSNVFRKIGRYCLLIFIMTGFRWMETENASYFGIYINYLPLMFMLGAFILAEIFDEGNKLYEAEQLTI
ncbi:hypothetical protein ABID22_003572 [Pontibacter aydingkolensis]|uniref:DUF2975 domain-containing protein n=1 Tax=Pontibacter aydingkolensis TaxID=1911536 RepID=A0ABS7CYJ6_9BACT|nr:DUF2975 domain-containing protein [Pontibacter aydingkolensis]MBW7468880.1 DUF2975 domain-containing protein [Pontibacter aydingkolensis]